MCKYCNNSFKNGNVTPLFELDEYDYVIVGACLYRSHLYRHARFHLNIAVQELKYCPMCGGRLNADRETGA